MRPAPQNIPMPEFIILMASLTALIAISIDAMLPALSMISHDLNVVRHNSTQLVISFIFLGMTIGQLIYGPVADAWGRKPTLFFGIGIYILGSIICLFSHNLILMLTGRFLQGIGASAPRIVTMAIIRDKYHGRDMARIFSLVMGVFILVPCIAPSLGQAILHVASWRMIFAFYIICAVIAAIWSYFRLSETLTEENKRPLDIRHILSGLKTAATTPVTLGYTIASGLAFSSLLGYLHSAQQVFQDIFQAGEMFSIYFGILAFAIGAAFFTNSALVKRFGMRKITKLALIGQILCAVIFAIYTHFLTPTLIPFMLFASASFFCLGLTFGNMNAMAMEPMGHMAGLASAFIGALSTAISVCLGTLIGQMYNGTLIPITIGFLCLGTASFIVMTITEKLNRKN